MSNKEIKQTTEQLLTDPTRMVPKYCNKVLANKTDTHLELSFVYQSVDQQQIIERVIVDLEHAKKISDLIKDLLEKKVE